MKKSELIKLAQKRRNYIFTIFKGDIWCAVLKTHKRTCPEVKDKRTY